MSLKLESLFRTSCFYHASASLDSEIPITTTAAAGIISFSPAGETKRRIAKLFDKKEVSISTYDTAWVAMAPSPFSSEEPCFPDCLSWLLENQCGDGSWARPHHHSLLKKDVLSSTLACILALNKWGLGQDQIKRGLRFLELNFGSATEDGQISPMGFDIIFPGMLDEARDLSLNLRLDPIKLNDLMNKRDLELKRCSSDEVYVAYVGEGMGNKSQDWESVVMKYQRRNGSLFNSPSTTAAAFTALRNSDCLKYLNVVLNKFGDAVPAVYPLDIYSQLCTVDNLQRLGISRYVSREIQSVLDETYRCWVQGDEEIFLDASTWALAFRILRMNGYDVASNQITTILEQSFSSSIVDGRMMDMNTALELYKASEYMLHPHETDLEKQHLRLRSLLEQESSSGIIQSCQLGRNINTEVKQALDYPFYAILERMATRKNIEHFNFDNTRILKTSCFTNSGEKDLFNLAVEDYTWCQAIHREEFIEFNRWYEDNRLDELEFARHKSVYCYFTAAANLFAPELSDARMCWAKNALMISIIDDLYDVRGTLEESRNLVHVVELWDVDVSTECCSQNVEIIFSALKSTICEFGDKGSKLQGRNVTNHIIAVWLDLLHTMMQETEWSKNKTVPTFDEYMTCSYVSFGLGPIVLPTLYFVGPKLSEEMVNHAECHNLFKMMSTFGRLLNDIRVDERELNDGKPTGLPLYITKMGGEITTEDAIWEIRSEIIEPQRRQLLRLVLDNTSVLPKPCKELFLNMCSVLFLFYSKDDGFWAQELIQVVNQILHQPIQTKHLTEY